jgi:hypothetical protein
VLPIGPEQDLALIVFCPACLGEPHGLSEDGEPQACPEVVRAGGEG